MKPSREDLERLRGKTVVASISGGKDSAAMSLWLTENDIPHRRVFLDTGWEHPWTYDYLRGPLTRALGPIEEVSTDYVSLRTKCPKLLRHVPPGRVAEGSSNRASRTTTGRAPPGPLTKPWSGLRRITGAASLTRRT